MPKEDRAAVVTIAITQIFATAVRDWLAGDDVSFPAAVTAIENALRDEIADAVKHARDEMSLTD
jgi:hypothetical protein